MKKISIIGLGFVGFPMLIHLTNLKKNKKYIYSPIGIESDNENGLLIKKKIDSGILPISTSDNELIKKFNFLSKIKKLNIKNNIKFIKDSEIIIISINFDFFNKSPYNNLTNLLKNISKFCKKNSLIFFETTLPPGTCEKVILPAIKKFLQKRKMKLEDIYFAYSYERITPGKNYISSIYNNHRNYSGMNKISKIKAKQFIKTFISHKNYQVTELNSLTECETAKIIENSYRALNIAFIDEWNKFSMNLGLDINKILESIRVRESHKNIMKTGIGVGGYCLTKDPSFGFLSNKYYKKQATNFPLTLRSLKINNAMPDTTLLFLKEKIKNINNKKILLMGITYKEDVGDERFSPVKKIANFLKKRKNYIYFNDPFIEESKEIQFIKKNKSSNSFKNFDVVIFCVNHENYKRIKLKDFNLKTIFIDLNHVIEKKLEKKIKSKKIKFFKLGSYEKQ
jgi:UDP-N-acetyl-D-glucosamine dehydrogenase